MVGFESLMFSCCCGWSNLILWVLTSATAAAACLSVVGRLYNGNCVIEWVGAAIAEAAIILQ